MKVSSLNRKLRLFFLILVRLEVFPPRKSYFVRRYSIALGWSVLIEFLFESAGESSVTPDAKKLKMLKKTGEKWNRDSKTVTAQHSRSI